ncbi:MAG: GAF domain-containing protein [Anaerolineae bacterium]
MENNEWNAQPGEETEETATLLRISQAIISPLALTDVLAQIVEQAARYSGADRSSIWLLSEDGHLLLPAAFFGMDEEFVQEWKKHPLRLEDELLSQEAISTSRPVVVTDARTDPRTDKGAVGFFDDKSILVVPLLTKGRTLGTLFLNHVQKWHPFNEKEVEMAMAIAAQAALAIENASLYEQAKSSLAVAVRMEAERTRLLRESQRMSEKLRRSFHQVGMALASSLDLDETLQLIVHLAADILDAQVCYLWLLSEDGQTLTARAAYGVKEARPLRLEVGQDLSGQVVRSGQPLHVPDMQAYAELPHSDIVFSEGLHTYLGVPLLLQDRVIGALALCRREISPFSEEETELLSSFAHQASIAIEEAQLFAAMSREKKEIEAIFQKSADGIMIIDRQRKVADINPALERMLGHSRQEVIGKPCWNILGEHDINGTCFCDEHCPLKSASQETDSLYAEHVLIDCSERKIDVGVSYGLIRDDNGEISKAIAIVRDISKQKELDRLRSDFVSTVSHELRTPLALIKGYISTLRRRDIVLDEAQRERFLLSINQAADRLTRLISDLLSLSRIEAEKLELHLQPVHVGQIVQEVVERFRHHQVPGTSEVPETFPSLDVELDGKVRAVLADPDRVEEVLLNLLDNAIKFSPNGGKITVRVENAHKVPGVMVSVSDQGVGIPPAHQERIFERFYRAEIRGSKKAPGVGLGLYICKRFVEAHGGQIWVESEPGRGSTFYFILPYNLSIKEEAS